MSSSARYFSPSDAAERLGISQKALRLYEQRGLLTPGRTAAGWRSYGPVEMARAAETVALRALGLSLIQVERVLNGDPQSLSPALATHQKKLEEEIRRLSTTVATVRDLRSGLAYGRLPKLHDLSRLARPAAEQMATFDLPWPWGGERFELHDVKSLNYIVGPLGSGKTRLARTIAENVSGAVFIGLDRAKGDAAEARSLMEADRALKVRIEHTLSWLQEDGATVTADLTALVAALEANVSQVAVVDMVEQGLDQDTQQAVITHLRARGAEARPIFMLTRSSAILDPSDIGPDEAIIFCPANHSPPMRVMPVPGAPGYEAMATCLGSPDVRARTEGVIAFRPQKA